MSGRHRTNKERWVELGLRSSMVAQGLKQPKEGEVVMDPQRTLSDADVKAIAKQVLDDAVERWYVAAGKGFTKMTTYVAIAVITMAALFFYVRGR